MAGLSLSQAAKASDRSKSTIGRAIKSGRLSATRNDDDTFSIDPSELFRVFPRDGRGTDQGGTDGTGMEQDEIRALRIELSKAEQRLAVAEAQAEERARALLAAERNLSDLRRMLPSPIINEPKKHPRSFWQKFLPK